MSDQQTEERNPKKRREVQEYKPFQCPLFEGDAPHYRIEFE